MTALGQAKRRHKAAQGGRGAGVVLACALVLSACAEAQLGVALAKRANESLNGTEAPSAATPATTGPGAAPLRAAQPPPSGAYDDRALTDGPPMIRDAALFSVEAQTLWDGLPSLGGVWVAHPGVHRDLTVEAVNLSNGRSMRLPAFRLNQRPGRPSIQLSAEAALALGMAPGRLTQVQLTGLRAKPEAPAPRMGGAVETFDLTPSNAQAQSAQTQTAQTQTPTIPAPAAATDAPRRAAPAIRPDLAADAAHLPALPAAEAASALSPGASPAPSLRPGGGAPQPASRSSAGPVAQPDAAAAHVQVGAFGNPANAADTVALLRARGLPVVALPAGRLTRVLLGPFNDLATANAARDQATGAGFTDAYVTVQ